MSLTTTQRQAVEARGDTLVMAGAGTGKTHTLVEACVQRLLREEEDIGIDEILMVTFTEAAAAEIRQRIRLRLEAEGENRSVSDRLQAQLAALDSAHISTLHSFCMRLLREHYHELEIDPEMNVLAAEQSALLASETLDEMFERHYGDESPESEAVRRFLLEQTRGWEDRARDLILEIHHFTQTRPNPAGWFEEQLAHYAEPEPHRWRRWLGEGFLAWRAYWLPELAAQEPDNSVAAACLALLQSMSPEETCPENPPAVERVTELAGHILDQDAPDRWTQGRKTKFRKPLEKLFEDAAFLHAFDPAGARAGTEPLAEDWHWVREPMTTLVRVVACSAANLEAAVQAGAFSRALFERLAACALEMPSLRDRRRDIPLLAQHFLKVEAPARRFDWSATCLEKLLLYDWPGNVRELHNVMRRLTLVDDDVTVLRSAHLPKEIRKRLRTASEDSLRYSAITVHAVPSRAELARLLEEYEGNVARVAEHYAKDRRHVYRWLTRHDLSAADFRK
jgi:hypothetical protein